MTGGARWRGREDPGPAAAGWPIPATPRATAPACAWPRERDVFVEAIKDGAVGMYDRRVALRTRERVEALGDFTTLTPERARALAAQYDLDYLVAEQRAGPAAGVQLRRDLRFTA